MAALRYSINLSFELELETLNIFIAFSIVNFTSSDSLFVYNKSVFVKHDAHTSGPLFEKEGFNLPFQVHLDI